MACYFGAAALDLGIIAVHVKEKLPGLGIAGLVLGAIELVWWMIVLIAAASAM